jgi:SOS response regulatory protein OraA/RecX
VKRSLTALEVAAAALAHRDRSTAALAAYLEQRGVAPEEAAAAIERLERAGYVSDARFALARAEVLADRGWGDEGIRHDLERQGIEPETVEAALAALEAEAARARRLAERFGPTPATARKLAAKGFTGDSIELALGQTLSE